MEKENREKNSKILPDKFMESVHVVLYPRC